MIEQKVDRRVRKTKRQLRAALTELMMEKSVGEITVREIAEVADVNRGTFYAHYRDVNDLLKQLEDNIFVRLEEISVSHSDGDPEESLYKYLVDMLTLCADSSDIYGALVCRNGDMEFQNKFFETLKDQYVHNYLMKSCTADEKVINMYCSYFVSGMLSIVKDWINSGLRETPEEMAQYGRDFIFNGIQAIK